MIGRFLSVDPVTADGNTGDNFNRYWYANNNPYAFTDPDGRSPRLIGDASMFGFMQSFLNSTVNECRFCLVRGRDGPPPGEYESPEEEKERRERERSEKREKKKEGKRGKYEPPKNENKRPPPEHRKPTGDRERNVGHPEGEEHSRKPKGGVRIPFIRTPWLICPACSLYFPSESAPPEPEPMA
jgi:hypothetical protein